MEKFKVSIIIPIYNVEKYLKQCLDSIQNQVYKNLEILMIDDGSTDNSSTICQNYLFDSRFHYIEKENGGVSSARNKGLEIATGEYIVFVDSDDILPKNGIKILVNLVTKNNVLIGAGDFLKVYSLEDINKQTLQKEKKEYICTYREAVQNAFYEKVPTLAPWSIIYHNSLWKNMRYKEDIIHEDLDVFYKLFSLASKIACTNQIVYIYRKRNESITTSLNNLKEKMKIIDIYNEIEKYFIEDKEIILAMRRLQCINYINLYKLIRKNSHTRNKEEAKMLYFQIKNISKECLKNKRIPISRKLKIVFFLIFPNIYVRLN